MCIGAMSEENLLQLVLSFYHGTEDQNLVAKLLFYPLSIPPARVGLDF